MGCYSSSEVRNPSRERSAQKSRTKLQRRQSSRSSNGVHARRVSSTSDAADDTDDGNMTTQSRSSSRLAMNRITRREVATIDVENEFSVIEELGRGSYASVQHVIHNTTKEHFAVKIFNKDALEKEKRYVEEEIAVMQQFGAHNNVVQLHYVQETDSHIYLVIDYVCGGNLLTRALKHGRMTEDVCARVVRSIASGLARLHMYGIAHRDLKLENILCVSKTSLHPVKVADFGLAKAERYFHPVTQELTERILKTACGSPLYVAPEIIAKKPYSMKVDMWSLGVITYSLLSGTNPFYVSGMSNKHLFRRIQRGVFDFPSERWSGVSRACKKFICRLLTVDPRRRMSADEVIIHPWVCSSNWSGRQFAPDLSHTDPLHVRHLLARSQGAAMNRNHHARGQGPRRTPSSGVSSDNTVQVDVPTALTKRGIHRRQVSRVSSFNMSSSAAWIRPTSADSNGQRRTPRRVSSFDTQGASHRRRGSRRSHTPRHVGVTRHA